MGADCLEKAAAPAERRRAPGAHADLIGRGGVTDEQCDDCHSEKTEVPA